MKRVECSSCHVFLEIEAEYYAELRGQTLDCPACNAEVKIPGTQRLHLEITPSETKECPSCRSGLVPDVLFCVQCGYDLRNGYTHAIAQATELRPRMLKAVLLGGVAVVLLLAIFLVTTISTSRKRSPISWAQPTTQAVHTEPESQQAEYHELLARYPTEQNEMSFSGPSSIKGSIHILFEGYDLPLKQVPVYLIPFSVAFQNTYNRLAEQAIPLLQTQSETPETSREWIQTTEDLIEVEKERVVDFREHTSRTVYADNNGMFAFHDLKQGQYMVFVEGTVKDRMTIWSALVVLTGGDSQVIDFGESNVGGTERVYSYAQRRSPANRSNPVSTSLPQQYSGDELCDMGVAAANQGDNRRAVEYFSAGAEAGHALCQYNLGASYIDGLGVPEDIDKGITLYRMAADQGLPVAQTKLGLAYYRGVGVHRDLSAAIHWLTQASNRGDQVAVQMRTELLIEYYDSTYGRVGGVYQTALEANDRAREILYEEQRALEQGRRMNYFSPSIRYDPLTRMYVVVLTIR